MSEQNESQEKAAYAALLLKERDPFKAALQLFPNNTNRALWVANHWPTDPEVIEAKAALMADAGEMGFLPGKAELANDIWQRMQGTQTADGRTIPPTAEEYVKLAKLYADVRGFIEKPQTNVNVVNNIPRVVEMPVFADESEWEAAAARQQRELLANARTRH